MAFCELLQSSSTLDTAAFHLDGHENRLLPQDKKGTDKMGTVPFLSCLSPSGGCNAIGCLIKVKGLSFLEAAHKLGAKEIETPKERVLVAQRPKTFSLPLPA
jgi:hypothetical protein